MLWPTWPGTEVTLDGESPLEASFLNALNILETDWALPYANNLPESNRRLLSLEFLAQQRVFLIFYTVPMLLGVQLTKLAMRITFPALNNAELGHFGRKTKLSSNK